MCNHQRPHRKLGYQTPASFTANKSPSVSSGQGWITSVSRITPSLLSASNLSLARKSVFQSRASPMFPLNFGRRENALEVEE